MRYKCVIFWSWKEHGVVSKQTGVWRVILARLEFLDTLMDKVHYYHHTNLI